MKASAVPRWTHTDCAVFDGEGSLVARARSAEEARRIAAAVNFVECVSTEALEAWKVGVLRDPINDLAGELESLLGAPVPGERRSGDDRRRSDRRRPATLVTVPA